MFKYFLGYYFNCLCPTRWIMIYKDYVSVLLSNCEDSQIDALR